MYTRSFLCEEAKIKQRTPLKKELREIGEEAIWESRFTSFLLIPFLTSPLNESVKSFFPTQILQLQFQKKIDYIVF